MVEKPVDIPFNHMKLKSLYRKDRKMANQLHMLWLWHTTTFVPTMIVLLVQSSMMATLLTERMPL
jgi:mannose/fructose/N-acetylgalactosamine-specific phosphotransferase system component IIC